MHENAKMQIFREQTIRNDLCQFSGKKVKPSTVPTPGIPVLHSKAWKPGECLLASKLNLHTRKRKHRHMSIEKEFGIQPSFLSISFRAIAEGGGMNLQQGGNEFPLPPLPGRQFGMDGHTLLRGVVRKLMRFRILQDDFFRLLWELFAFF